MASGAEVVRVSVPGKVILMGEHAVVYGRPALVTTVGCYLRVELSRQGSEGLRLRLFDLGVDEHFEWSTLEMAGHSARELWHEGGVEASRLLAQARNRPSFGAEIAVAEALRALESAGEHRLAQSLRRQSLALAVRSALPIGSGMGSSAALAVAVFSALFGWLGYEPSDEERQSVALEIERRQHGTPSGVDSTAVLKGGILWFERRRDLEQTLEAQTVSVPCGFSASLRACDTGSPAEKTGDVVAHVRSLREREGVGSFERRLDRMESLTRSLRHQLEAGFEIASSIEIVREFEACLEELEVVPGEIRSVIRQVEKLGGAAKIAGAGSITGPASGLLLILHPEPERVLEAPFVRDFRLCSAALGVRGARLEGVVEGHV